ncbi:MAG TPA: OmpA family protein [Leptospiraceae bacterium]|nr:OmpA family protein [Leptospiraceae bacterium]HNF15078.1 OmpA family protein [Leptospiraceae bacterium]HNM03060.1 OmpA family protein [Leptospiraceae bacterium]HNN05566.1 OmpA family protein [Leptospiraceae bacterium]
MNSKKKFPGIQILLIVFSAVQYYGCFSWNVKETGPKEPEAVEDAVPPAGYAPVFMKKTEPLSEEKPESAETVVTRTDTRNERKVRAYVHILDKEGTYLSGGTDKKRKNRLFCGVTDTLNGKSQEIKNYTVKEITEKESRPIALAVIMDNSGSMGDARAAELQRSVSDFIDKKRPQDLIAVLRYDSHTEIEVPLTAEVSEIRSGMKINGLQGFGGLTAIHSSIYKAVDHLNEKAPSNAEKNIIIFTDGIENSSTVGKDETIAHAVESNVFVHTVDFGNRIQAGYMKEIADLTGGLTRQIYGKPEFQKMYEDMYSKVNNSYIIEYPVKEQGEHEVELKQCWKKGSTVSSFKYKNTPHSYRKHIKRPDLAPFTVYFKGGRDLILKDSIPDLDRLMETLQKTSYSVLEIQGHTAPGGIEKENFRLSEARAASVRKYLVKRGVTEDRMEIRGLGSSEPAAVGKTEEDLKKNRRVTFLLR